jgi:hypothetical protein
MEMIGNKSHPRGFASAVLMDVAFLMPLLPVSAHERLLLSGI